MAETIEIKEYGTDDVGRFFARLSPTPSYAWWESFGQNYSSAFDGNVLDKKTERDRVLFVINEDDFVANYHDTFSEVVRRTNEHMAEREARRANEVRPMRSRADD